MRYLERGCGLIFKTMRNLRDAESNGDLRRTREALATDQTHPVSSSYQPLIRISVNILSCIKSYHRGSEPLIKMLGGEETDVSNAIHNSIIVSLV